MARNAINAAVSVLLACVLMASPAPGQKPVPVVDGEAGPCSVEFIALDSNGKSVYGARITVHIEFGFLGLKELDLQVTTNADGIARFEGLPDETESVLFFEAFTESLKGVAVFNPSYKCSGRHSIYMAQRTTIHESASEE
jgi:hypothetical protein